MALTVAGIAVTPAANTPAAGTPAAGRGRAASSPGAAGFAAIVGRLSDTGDACAIAGDACAAANAGQVAPVDLLQDEPVAAPTAQDAVGTSSPASMPPPSTATAVDRGAAAIDSSPHAGSDVTADGVVRLHRRTEDRALATVAGGDPAPVGLPIAAPPANILPLHVRVSGSAPASALPIPEPAGEQPVPMPLGTRPDVLMADRTALPSDLMQAGAALAPEAGQGPPPANGEDANVVGAAPAPPRQFASPPVPAGMSVSPAAVPAAASVSPLAPARSADRSDPATGATVASAAVPSPGIASPAMLLPPTPPVIVQDPPSGGGSQATPTAAMGSSHAAASTDRAGTTAGAIDIDSAVLGGVRVAVAATAAQLTVHFTAARSDTAARIVAAAAQLDAPIAAAGLRLEAVTVATVHADAGTAAFGGGMLDPGTREHRREASSRASRLPMPKGRSGPTASADRFA